MAIESKADLTTRSFMRKSKALTKHAKPTQAVLNSKNNLKISNALKSQP
jgi:hypothetical protein